MPQFRKRPVVIEAVQFTGGNLDTIYKFTGSSMSYTGYNESIQIHTLEGTMTASKGDWIIKGVAGEFYPCKHDIFEKTYEEVHA